MTFTWTTPPWQRFEDCTHMAVILSDTGGKTAALNATSVRGDNATEALADLLMGPGSVGVRATLPGIFAVVIRRGIDVLWMAQPPIYTARASDGEWDIGITKEVEDEVTPFSQTEVQDLFTRLQAAYGA